MKVTAKDQPKWYNFRWKLSNSFVKIGQRIYPENPEVKAFWLQILSDQMICGNSVIRINPKEKDIPHQVNAVVIRIASLVEDYCKIQGIGSSREGILKEVARDLRRGWIACPHCEYNKDETTCTKCHGTGKIPYAAGKE